MLSSDIRACFLKFFEDNDHRILESSSLIPQNDPSLLFTNAGMVQFKNVFTGLETREYRRATTSQKCLRAGGKLNDLDQVGFTPRHHTFFEMLGNFSFGDYFKEEAIHFAWTFLEKELGLSRKKMLVTTYHSDEEAQSIWKKVAGDIVIVPIATSDNFWSMGDTGPCGPCSEIFYDHGENVPGGMPGTPDQDGDRYMEVWNIVFMQFEQMQNGKRIPLEKKSIDTGMGLERIAGIMQGVQDNYQIDLFKGIINETKAISRTNFESTYSSYKVIADHIRSVSFLIADGILPSNEGRGYVLRRILRRAMRHGNLININDPFLFKLSDSFIDSIKAVYPELEKARAMISSTIRMEEEKFLVTLERGLKVLQHDIKEIPPGSTMSGDKAFKLYDTYGFPLDLTQDILKSENICVDVAEFDIALEQQKKRAKWTGSGEVKEDKIWYVLREKIEPTEFTGYEKEKECSEALSMIQAGEEVISISTGDKAFMVAKSTPFYAECGGQCGDTGFIESKTGIFKVTNTKKFCNEIIGHEGEVLSGYIQNSDAIELRIDGERRQKIKANHTATHLLHAALRTVLGEHVIQRGSFLNEDRLRFDFSHNSAVSNRDILEIEKLVNGWILQDFPVTYKIMSPKEAISSGAMALFGEKYGDSVRTISIAMENAKRISFELCGGTHVLSTGRIGLFKILSESSIGFGIRRIEAITGEKILEYLKQIEEIVDSLSEKLKSNRSDLFGRVEDLLIELKQKNQKILLSKQKSSLEKIQEFSRMDAKVYTLVVSGHSMEELRSLNDFIRSQKSSGIVVIANCDKNKVSLVVGVSSDLQNKYSAEQLLRRGLSLLNGKGGGNVALAQGGGEGEDKITPSIELIVSSIN
ncbi:MAG: alanine--tRNA ligase [Holosporaceae bacterium]|jgi:alanyl-tRNA synthetase|nr:alanine--tRNA ligase [Holosporaceae bacterium]